MRKVTLRLRAVKNKTDINFTCYSCIFDVGNRTLYLFYPDGRWDENKYTLVEALAAYPADKYEWIFFND